MPHTSLISRPIQKIPYSPVADSTHPSNSYLQATRTRRPATSVLRRSLSGQQSDGCNLKVNKGLNISSQIYACDRALCMAERMEEGTQHSQLLSAEQPNGYKLPMSSEE